MIAAKEPWRLGSSIGVCKALIASGKEAFIKLKEAAGVYGELLDLLKAHKWIYINLATDDGFRAAYKLKARKRTARLRAAAAEKPLNKSRGLPSRKTLGVFYAESLQKRHLLLRGQPPGVQLPDLGMCLEEVAVCLL